MKMRPIDLLIGRVLFTATVSGVLVGRATGSILGGVTTGVVVGVLVTLTTLWEFGCFRRP